MKRKQIYEYMILTLSLLITILILTSYCFSKNYFLEIHSTPEDMKYLRSLIESQPWCDKNKIIVNSSSLMLGPFDLKDAESIKKKIMEELNLSCNIYTEMLVPNKLLDEIFEKENINHTDDEFDIQVSSYSKELTHEMLHRYQDEKVKKIIRTALQLYATPYKLGGANVECGIDCSFFVKYVFAELGIKLPRTSREQFQVGRPVAKEDLQCGDLVFFKKVRYTKVKGKIKKYEYINHVGIYLQNNEFIHATRSAKKVTISSLEEPYYKNHYAGARRVIKNGL